MSIEGFASDNFGRSVALSADASIMAIGASSDFDYTGYVEVYSTDDDGGNRVQLGQTIYGNALMTISEILWM
jgi:hypothetical protein